MVFHRRASISTKKNAVLPPPTLDLPPTSDVGSGTNTDNVTTASAISLDMIFGMPALAGDIVQIRDGTTIIITRTLDADDVFNAQRDFAGTAISMGAHPFSGRHSRGGIWSPWGTVLTVTRV